MASIDNRIVNMEFNNGEFEKRVSDTMKTLAGLDKAIAMTGTQGNGLEAIAKSASSFNMDGMSSAIEGVSAKFIALSTIGITALANLTNKAVDAGLSIAKSLAIAPISSGFTEYELKLNSIQTIMAGTGANLETVNSKLQELNTYSDQTIYSFADMTSNIGKFTNAGVSLDQSVASIKGIANVAALSGANSEEASRAMYNFAQALSKGYVQLVDWKSIELANMGTTEFKTQLLQAAEAAGTLTKQGENWVTAAGTVVSANQNFNDSLTDQWLTTEALNGALADYADASTDIGARATAAASDVKTFTQLMDVTKESIGSGWSQSFEILVGNFDEAKWLFGGINKQIGDIIGKNAQARNDMLQGWKDMGGRNEFIIGVDALVKNLAAMFGPIKDAFREVFPPMTSERLFAITHAFMEFALALKPSEKTIDNIKRVFKGLFNILSVGIDVIKFLVGTIKDFVVNLTGAGSGKALGFLAELGDMLANVSSDKIIAGIEATFGKLVELIQWPIPYIQNFIDKVREFIEGLNIKMPSGFSDAIGTIQKFFSDIFGNLPDASPLTELASRVGSALGDIGSAIGNALASLGGGIGGAIGGVLSTIGGAFSGIVDAISGLFSSGGELEKKVKESSDGINWEMVMGGVGVAAIGGLVATLNRLISQGINIDFTGGVLTSISGTFDQLTGTLKTMQQQVKADVLIKIAGAIGILAVAMFGLSFIDPEKLVKSAVAIGVAFGELAAAMKIMQKIDFTTGDAAKFTLMAVGFGILAGGMVLLSGAVLAMGSMKTETLAKGMAAFGAVVAALVVMSKQLENEAAGMVKASVSLMFFAFGMDFMYGAIKKFAEMDTAKMAQGFVGVAGAMVLLIGTMKLLPKDTGEKTAGLLGFTIALNLMAFAIKQLGGMQLGDLVQGGTAFALMLGGLVLAMRMMPPNLAATAGQILALGAAMLIMSFALKMFGSMGWEEIARGLIAMAGALGVLVLAMMAASGGIVGAGAILIMSVALLVLAAAVKAFAAIGLGDFAKGMLLVVVALAALAGVALLLAPAVPALLGLGLALAALGLGIAAIGFGALQIAKAIAVLAGVEDVGKVIMDVFMALGKAIPAIFIGIAEGIGAFIQVLIGFIPIFVEFGVKLLSALLEGLTTILPKILEFIGVLITSILDLIVTLIPEFVSTGLKLLLGLIQGITENLSEIVGVIVTLITEFIDAISENLPKIIDAGLDLLMAFLDGILLNVSFIMDAVTKIITTMIDELASHATEIIDSGTEALTSFLQGISDNLSTIIDTVTEVITQFISDIASMANDIIDAGADALVNFLQGISDNISTIITTVTDMIIQFVTDVGTNMWRITDAGADVLTTFLKELTGDVVQVGDAVAEMIGQIITAVGDNLEDIVEAGTDIVISLLDKMGDSAIEIGNAIGDFALDVAEGVEAASEKFEKAGRSIAGSIIDGITLGMAGKVTGVVGGAVNLGKSMIGGVAGAIGANSPAKKFIPLGEAIPEGLAVGVKNGNYMALDAVDNMSVSLISSVAKVVEDVSYELSDLGAMNPTITPVLDLTNVRAGAATIGGLLAMNSANTAGTIASSQRYSEDSIVGAGVTEIKFEQTINAPTQLSTADIYRQTRNQITIAKEELSIA